MSSLYYAALHAASMVLAAHGLAARTHEGTQRLFAAHFVRTGEFPKAAARELSVLYGRRQAADYQGFVEFDEADIDEALDRIRPLIEQAVTNPDVDFSAFDRAWSEVLAASRAGRVGGPASRSAPS